MSIYDIHTHHHPDEPGTAIVQLMPDSFTPHPNHYYSVGIHPWHITDDWRIQMSKLYIMAQHQQVVMIGEAGIDKKNSPASLELQIEVFREHVQLSQLLHKPLIIHCIKAFDELFAIRRESKATLPWILHGFRGGIEQWQQLSRAGIFVSIGQYYNTDLIHQIPLSALLLESDDYHSISTVYERVSKDIGTDTEDIYHQVKNNIYHLLEQGSTTPF